MRQSLRTALTGIVLSWGLCPLNAGPAGAAGARGFLSGQADEPVAELRGDAGGLQAASRHLAQIAAAATPSVVHILAEHDARNGTIEETGSGVLLTSPRAGGVFVVTNRHVIAAARLNAIQIHLQDGRVVNELYDKGADYDELRDAAGLEDERLPALRSELELFLRAQLERRGSEGEEGEGPVEALRALGYAGN